MKGKKKEGERRKKEKGAGALDPATVMVLHGEGGGGGGAGSLLPSPFSPCGDCQSQREPCCQGGNISLRKKEEKVSAQKESIPGKMEVRRVRTWL